MEKSGGPSNVPRCLRSRFELRDNVHQALFQFGSRLGWNFPTAETLSFEIASHVGPNGQPLPQSITPKSRANATAWVRLLAPNFEFMLRKCVRTVLSETNKLLAIAPFE